MKDALPLGRIFEEYCPTFFSKPILQLEETLLNKMIFFAKEPVYK